MEIELKLPSFLHVVKDSLPDINSLINSNDFSITLLRLYFSSMDDFISFIQTEENKQKKTLCTGSIALGEISWKCYDCGFENESHIICDDCFKHGEHKGHRIQPSVERSGCCDCGDIGALEKFGFCSKHKGEEVRPETIEIPSFIKEGLEKFFLECIYTYVFYSEKSEIDNSDQSSFKISNLAYVAFFNFISNFASKSVNLLYFMTEFLMDKRFEQNEKYFFLFHDCEFLHDITIGIDQKACKCSFLELIFKFSGGLTSEIQEWSEKVLYVLFPDSKFKSYLTEIFTKCIHFLIKFRYDLLEEADKNGNTEDLTVSKKYCYQNEMRPIYTQFFSEELKSHWLYSQYFDFLTIILKNSLRGMALYSYEGSYKTFINIVNLHFFIQNGKSKPVKFYVESDYLNKLLDAIMDTPILEERDIMNCKYLLHCYGITVILFCECLEAFIPNDGCDYERQKNKLKNLIIDSMKGLERYFEFFKSHFNIQQYPFIYCLIETNTKIFSSLISFYYCYFKEDFSAMILEIKSSNPEYDTIMRNLFFIKLGQMIYLKYPKSASFFQFTKLLKPEIEDLTTYYNWVKLNGTSFDILFLQIVLLTIDSGIVDSVIQFSIISIDPILSYNQEVYLESSQYLKKIILATILDDISLINTVTNSLGKTKCLEIFKKPLKNFISSFFLIQNYFSFKSLRNYLTKANLNKETPIEDMLKEIVSIIPESKNLKLDNAFIDTFDPIVFYFRPSIYNEIIGKIEEFNKLEICDLIIGKTPERETKIMSFEILQRLANSNFDAYVISTLSNYNSTNDVTLSLRFLYECLNLKQNYSINTKCSDFFISKANKLAKIIINIELKCEPNIKPSLKKLKSIIENFSSTKISSEGQNIQKELDDSDKAAKYKEKVERLKAQFSIKQNEFLQKFKESGENENLNSEFESKKTCIFCHSSTNIPENCLGYICYANTDSLNQFSGIYGDEKLKYSITTCGHFLHFNCYFEKFINEKPPNSFYIYKNETLQFEFNCPFCKFYGNCLIPSLDIFFKGFPKLKKTLDNDNFLNCVDDVELKKRLCEKFDYQLKNSEKELNEIAILENFSVNSISRTSPLLDKTFITILGIFQNTIDSEFFIINVFLDSLFVFSELYSIESHSEFLKKKGDFYRNLFIIAKITLVSFQSEQIHKFVESLYKKLDILISKQIYFEGNEDISQYIYLFDTRMTQIFWISNLLLNTFEANNLNSFVFNYSIEILKSLYYSVFNTGDGIDPQIRFMADGYIQSYQNLFNCLMLLTNNINSDKFDINLNQKDTGIIDDMVSKMSDYSTYKINSQLVVNKVFKFSNISLEEKNILVDLLQVNQMKKFKIFKLGETYLDTNNILMEKKCSMCGYFPKKKSSEHTICLLCGEILCMYCCSNKTVMNGKSRGNLYYHSVMEHSGTSIFVESSESGVIYIDKDFIGFKDQLYFDSLGQQFKRNEVKWREFTLDHYRYSHLEQLAISRLLPQTLFWIRLSSPNLCAKTDAI